MTVPSTEDRVPTTADTGSVRLRTDMYDVLAASKGFATVAQQAKWHGLARSAMYRLRGGGVPHLDTAMRMAADCGVAVEVIWERLP